jgi:hypothetical protein
MDGTDRTRTLRGPSMPTIDPDDHPLLLPHGYRIRHSLFVLPILVAGRYRWCEHVAVIQRYMHPNQCNTDDFTFWHTIGYYDEVVGSLAKQPAADLD